MALWIVAACGGGSATRAKAKTGGSSASAAGPSLAPLASGVQEGELALTLGDPVRAIRILSAVPESDNSYLYAQDLLAAARQDVDDVVKTWLTQVDGLVQSGKLLRARTWLNYMLSFPLAEADQLAVRKRQQWINEKTKDFQDELLETERRTRDLLLANELHSALAILKSKRGLAWEIDTDRALKWEQTIATIQAHAEKGSATGAVRRSSKGRRTARRKKPVGTTPAPEETPAAVPAEMAKVQELLALGKQAHAKADFFVAIKSYDTVLELAPSHPEALKALKALAGERKKLVDAWLAKANQHFLRQDLRGAVPYYEKVLVLEPDNKRAREGLRMYQNLERIRGGKKKP